MILDLPYVLETRRNHALEHATLHMLARTHRINMGGHSNPTGFFIFGELRTEDVRTALNEAYTRLRAGDNELAIHPGCGTNLVATALLPGTLAAVPEYAFHADTSPAAADCPGARSRWLRSQ